MCLRRKKLCNYNARFPSCGKMTTIGTCPRIPSNIVSNKWHVFISPTNEPFALLTGMPGGNPSNPYGSVHPYSTLCNPSRHHLGESFSSPDFVKLSKPEKMDSSKGKGISGTPWLHRRPCRSPCSLGSGFIRPLFLISVKFSGNTR